MWERKEGEHKENIKERLHSKGVDSRIALK
jgi:hypothetical protein